MDFLGVGPLELFFVLIIILIVLGPGDMVKVSQTLGRTLRKIIKSPTWQLIRNTSNSLRNLPNTLVREAGADELKEELLRGTAEIKELGKEIDPKGWGIENSIKPDFIPTSDTPTPSKDGLFPAWTTQPEGTDVNQEAVEGDGSQNENDPEPTENK